MGWVRDLARHGWIDSTDDTFLTDTYIAMGNFKNYDEAKSTQQHAQLMAQQLAAEQMYWHERMANSGGNGAQLAQMLGIGKPPAAPAPVAAKSAEPKAGDPVLWLRRRVDEILWKAA